jgi:hypothetical protein
LWDNCPRPCPTNYPNTGVNCPHIASVLIGKYFSPLF